MCAKSILKMSVDRSEIFTLWVYGVVYLPKEVPQIWGGIVCQGLTISVEIFNAIKSARESL